MPAAGDGLNMNGRFTATNLNYNLARVGHQLPVAVTFKFCVFDGSEWPVHGEQISSGTDSTRPGADQGKRASKLSLTICLGA